MESPVTRHFFRLSLTMMPLFAACLGSPTMGEQIEASLEAQLKSVEGHWAGTTYPASSNTITLDFTLTQQPNGQLQGSGTMKEANAPAPVAITITGTFHRPTLTLTLTGMIYEGRAVTGSIRGDYVTVGGVGDALRLTAEGYEKVLTILLQER